MTPERFHTIVDAYGADPRRWPKQERADAQAWAAAHRAEADAALASSAAIDAWLARDTVAPPDRELQQRIVESAPVRRPSWFRQHAWWSGAAIAGVGLTGGLAGALAVSFFVLTGAASSRHEQAGHEPSVHESSYLTTGFGGSPDDWSDE